mmetsp:Transcript_26717/g.61481  ORF Transcript_26717/g.61481 Transcript_26717/m.61481 type:complete len:357 (+) Transcript_26717:1171-2241(+)
MELQRRLKICRGCHACNPTCVFSFSLPTPHVPHSKGPTEQAGIPALVCTAPPFFPLVSFAISPAVPAHDLCHGGMEEGATSSIFATAPRRLVVPRKIFVFLVEEHFYGPMCRSLQGGATVMLQSKCEVHARNPARRIVEGRCAGIVQVSPGKIEHVPLPQCHLLHHLDPAPSREFLRRRLVFRIRPRRQVRKRPLPRPHGPPLRPGNLQHHDVHPVEVGFEAPTAPLFRVSRSVHLRWGKVVRGGGVQVHARASQGVSETIRQLCLECPHVTRHRRPAVLDLVHDQSESQGLEELADAIGGYFIDDGGVGTPLLSVAGDEFQESIIDRVDHVRKGDDCLQVVKAKGRGERWSQRVR